MVFGSTTGAIRLTAHCADWMVPTMHQWQERLEFLMQPVQRLAGKRSNGHGCTLGDFITFSGGNQDFFQSWGR